MNVYFVKILAYIPSYFSTSIINITFCVRLRASLFMKLFTSNIRSDILISEYWFLYANVKIDKVENIH